MKSVTPSKSVRRRAADEGALRRINRYLRRRNKTVHACTVKGRFGSKVARFYFLIDDRHKKVIRVFTSTEEFAAYFRGWVRDSEAVAHV
jgi:hypothetical protein